MRFKKKSWVVVAGAVAGGGGVFLSRGATLCLPPQLLWRRFSTIISVNTNTLKDGEAP